MPYQQAGFCFEGNVMNYTLKELLDIQRLQILLDISGIPCSILDADGNVLIFSSLQDICTEFHSVNRTIQQSCLGSDLRLKKGHVDNIFNISYRCPMGLVDAAMSIIIEGKNLGNVYIGQFFMEPQDEESFIRQAREHGFDEAGYLAAMQKVPFLSEEKLRKNLTFIHTLAQMLAEQGLQNKRQLEAEKALRESEQRYRLLIETASEGILVAQGSMLKFVNPVIPALTGYTVEELLSIPFLELIHHDDRELMRINYVKRIKGDDVGQRYEIQILTKDAGILWVEISGAPIEWEGQPAILNLVTDITKRKQAIKAFIESEARFRSYVENVNDIIFSLSAEGLLTYVSPNWKDTFGYEIDETIGRHFMHFVHPDDLSNCFSSLKLLLESGEKLGDIEYRVLHKNGKWIWNSTNGSILHDPESNQISYLGVGRDISERKRMDQQLNEVKNYLLTVFGASPAGFITFKATGEVVSANDAAARIIGLTVDELEKLNFRNLKAWKRYGLLEVADRVIATGKEERNDFNIISFRGKQIEVDCLFVPFIFCGEQHLMQTLIDISERKRTEQERLNLEKQLLHARKLESLGVMAGGIAHDFNNLLQSILGNMEIASKELETGSSPYEHIANAILSGKHAAHLTGLMLTYAGMGTTIKKELNLNELVRENTEMLRAVISSTVKLEWSLNSDLPEITADEAQIQQVVMNLITNAAESIEGPSGIVSLTTGMQSCDQIFLATSLLSEKVKPGCYVILEVSDNGCGMSQETLTRLFDPFFTTKFTGRGLGMSSVMGIIKNHGGALFVESEPGKGTIFRILFPVSTSTKSAGIAASVIPAVKECASLKKPLSGVALVVDDEKSVLKICEKMVQLCGFTVITACDGLDAVSKFREHVDEIVVVLMDSTMPNMDGITAMGEIYDIKPDIKIILTSGFNEDELSDRITCNYSSSGFIRKPYRISVLEAELRRVLQGNPPY